MKKFGIWVLDRWQPIIAGLAVLVIMISLFLFHLGTLNKGATVPEVNYINSLRSGKNLVADPNFLIHKLPVYVLFKLGVHTITIYRSVSVLFALISVSSSFVILKRIYSLRVAFLGAALLLTSAWILHIGRSATPEASFLLIMPLYAVATWLHITRQHYLALFVLALVLAISFYIPGFWWLVVLIIIWEHRAILAALKSVPWWFWGVCAFMLLVGVTPLIWAAAHHPTILLLMSGLPRHISDIRSSGVNALRIAKYLVIYGPSDPAQWLGRLPILDIFSTVMLILGVYSVRYHLKRYDISLLTGSSLILVILISAGGLVSITALIPLLYIFIGAGIAFMLQQWFTVFPRNPIARAIATTTMSITILLVSYYNISHYFIAWPLTPATKQAFGHTSRIAPLK